MSSNYDGNQVQSKGFNSGIAVTGVLLCIVTITLAATGLALTANPCNLRVRKEVNDAYKKAKTNMEDGKGLGSPNPGTRAGAEGRFVWGRLFSGLSVAGAVVWMILCFVGIGCQGSPMKDMTACKSTNGITQFVGENLTGSLVVGAVLILMAMIGNIALYNAGYTVVDSGTPCNDDEIPEAPATSDNHLDGVRIASIAGLTLAIGVGVGVAMIKFSETGTRSVTTPP